MSNPIITQVVQELEILPPNLQQQVLIFVQTLKDTLPAGVSGERLLQFAGLIPSDDLALMRLAIEKDCERVDLDEW